MIFDIIGGIMKTEIIGEAERRNYREYVKCKCFCGNIFEAKKYNITK